MAQISQISLADGQTTPAAHIFKPTLPQKGSEPAMWTNSETDTMVGNRKVTLRVLEKTNKFDVEARISDPVLSAIPDTCCEPGNIPVIAYTDVVSVSFSISKSSTEANRKDILAYAKNLLGTTVMVDAVTKLEQAW